MLIAIAGPDGVGKSTIAKLLIEELTAAGCPVRSVTRWDIVDNPGYPATRFLKANIRDLRDCVASMPSELRLMFLLWSMGMAIEPLLREPQPLAVVVDGYWMKHAASEIAYGLAESDVIAVAGMLPRADATFLLDAPPDRLYERKRDDLVPYECAMDPSCARASFIGHQNGIRSVLGRWAEASGWTATDADRPAGAIVRELAPKIFALLASENPR